MPRITVEFDSDIMKDLDKRAKKSYLSLKELIEDIVRRSMVSYSGGKKRYAFKPDDKLIEAFSRQKRGRKRKKR